MTRHDLILTPSEWKLMECLWEKSPRTGREASEYMRQSVGWTRSTTLTMLRRMTEKGHISRDEAGGVQTYSPLLCREDAMTRQTEDFLERVYNGSISMMVSAMTRRQELSSQEIAELYAILGRAEREART